MSKLPRLIDMIGPDKPKPEAQPNPRTITGADSRPVVMGEPMALDLSTVRRSRRHKTGITTDAQPLLRSCYGEPIPIDRSAINHRTRSASGPLAEDGQPYPLVQGETHRIAD